MIRIAVVIVAYNDSDTIEKTLKSVKHFGFGDYKIIVVDNQSSDGTADLVRRFLDIKLIVNSSNIGFGAANNIGMNSIDAEYYLLLNSDAYLQDGKIYKALDYLDANSDVGIAGIPLVYPDGSPQTSAYAFSAPVKWTLQLFHINKFIAWLLGFNMSGRLVDLMCRNHIAKTFINSYNMSVKESDAADGALKGETVDWVCGAAMIIRRLTFEKTGGFDEKIFMYGEDEDICLRAHALGFKVERISATPVVHDFGWGQNRKNGYAKIKHDSLRYFIRKHYQDNLFQRYWMLALLRIQILGWKAFLPMI